MTKDEVEKIVRRARQKSPRRIAVIPPLHSEGIRRVHEVLRTEGYAPTSAQSEQLYRLLSAEMSDDAIRSRPAEALMQYMSQWILEEPL